MPGDFELRAELAALRAELLALPLGRAFDAEREQLRKEIDALYERLGFPSPSRGGREFYRRRARRVFEEE